MGVNAATVKQTLDSISAQSRYAEGSKVFGEGGCWNFVNEVSTKLFGVSIPNKPNGYLLTGTNSYWYMTNKVSDSSATNNAVIELLKKSCAGDIIQYKNSYATWQHTAMIYDVTSSGITIYDFPNPTQGVSKKTYTWNNLINGIGNFGGISGYGISLYHCTLNSETPYTPTISINFAKDTSDQNRTQIGYTNAVLATCISVSGVPITDVSSVGIILYNSNDVKIGEKSEKPYLSGDKINAWYDVNYELGIILTKGTTYKYKFFVVVNGSTYTSSMRTFKTLGTTPSFTVTFNPTGGIVTPTSKTVLYDSEYGTLPTPTKTGFTFSGWYTSENDGTEVLATSKYNLMSNSTLYAHWTRLNCWMFLVAEGAETERYQHLTKYGLTYDYINTFPIPTRDGYIFEGWFTEDGKQINNSDICTITDSYSMSKRTTLYAHWSKAVTLGDLNNDNIVNSEDALIILKKAARLLKLDEQQSYIADLNGDSYIDTIDALIILKKAAGLIK